jgi:hypothetical protein
VGSALVLVVRKGWEVIIVQFHVAFVRVGLRMVHESAISPLIRVAWAKFAVTIYAKMTDAHEVVVLPIKVVFLIQVQLCPLLGDADSMVVRNNVPYVERCHGNHTSPVIATTKVNGVHNLEVRPFLRTAHVIDGSSLPVRVVVYGQCVFNYIRELFPGLC